MILVDTSIWIDHFRRSNKRLADLLEEGEVITHSFVVGELACGNLKNRQEILGLFANLPTAPVADDDEALHFITAHSLMGRGIGYVDVHLLAAAALHGDAVLWTRDANLAKAAAKLGLLLK